MRTESLIQLVVRTRKLGVHTLLADTPRHLGTCLGIQPTLYTDYKDGEGETSGPWKTATLLGLATPASELIQEHKCLVLFKPAPVRPALL